MAKSDEFAIRFAVGAKDGPRSGVWRAWSNLGQSDIYIAIRTIAGLNKVSLHPTGWCSASMTSQEARSNPAALQSQGGTRHLDKWQRPLLTGNLLSIPLRLRFPASELRPGIDTPSRNTKISWLPSPHGGHAIDVLCIFTSSAYSVGEWPWKSDQGNLLASTRLPNGETFWLISHLYRTVPELTATLDSRKPPGLPVPSRVLMGETGPASVRILTDAASDPSPTAA